MSCTPIDITLPDGPSGPAIPGFGIPSIPKLPSLTPILDFPENLLELLDKLQLLLPSGILKPSVNPNFGKDVFDGIMGMLDKFFPFLMFYKFFLPVLNMIICIIEVLCALTNPVKLAKAIKRLFRTCLPEFLSLFPIFALIVMLISLLLLILALIEYIIAKLVDLVKLIIQNIIALKKAFDDDADNSILKITRKIAQVLCSFQNLFVLLSIFVIIFQIIKDILSVAFSLPPCDDSNDDGCCSTDVCPSIVKSSYTRTTGSFRYASNIFESTATPGITLPKRSESFQFFDANQSVQEAFINIVDAYDVTVSPKPIFFPTDATYSAKTSPLQAPYIVDLKILYTPLNYNRTGIQRQIEFKDCIVVHEPSFTITNADNTASSTPTGTFILAGGKGYEVDGTTILYGYAADGVTPIATQATLENFFHQADEIQDPEFAHFTPGKEFDQVEYNFKPNFQVLQNKSLVSLGCEPSLDLNKTFVNGVFFGDAANKADDLTKLVNSDSFPDPGKTQECLMTAVEMFRSNMTLEGAADFQAMVTACLSKLTDDTTNSLSTLLGLGIDTSTSSFTLNPTIQFTSQPIKVAVSLKDRNGLLLTTNLPVTVAQTMATRLSGIPTFGQLSSFSYDGYNLFTANLTSDAAGKGSMQVAFDNAIFSTNIIPADINVDPSRILQEIPYEFIYSPSVGSATGVSGVDTDGQPRHDESDLGRENA